ncbi:MAG: 50S ribosomal protein L10 [Erysipelotrichaceae bacterium]|nr:50S ribosomal protein L10 [Erysipelotrichaceae bacterium]
MNEAIINSKKAVVTEIADKMKEAQSTVIVEYRGLSVAEVTQLRRELRTENVDFKVYKNSLAQRAAEAAGASELVKDLVGPNAIAFGNDAVAPARVLAKFAKDHEALVLKSGIVEGKVVGLDTIQKLSVLPNREGMIAKFMGCLQSPVRKFAVALNAVKEQKESTEA